MMLPSIALIEHILAPVQRSRCSLTSFQEIAMVAPPRPVRSKTIRWDQRRSTPLPCTRLLSQSGWLIQKVSLLSSAHPLDATDAADEALPLLREHVLQRVPELVEQRLHLPGEARAAC